MTTAVEILALCRDCAQHVYNKHKPTPEYAEDVAQLLFMTAAHESGGFRYRRQLGFARLSERGAFGLWQTEWLSALDSLRFLRRNVPLLAHSREWVDSFSALAGTPLCEGGKQTILATLQTKDGDPLGCLLARLHYLRIPKAIPHDVQAQSRYAKRYYNTRLGAATAEDYECAYYAHWPETETQCPKHLSLTR